MLKKMCAYCDINLANTVDHVPPRNIFPSPRPNNLITVPACDVCNNKYAKDEEYFMASMMFTYAGDSDAGKLLWKQKLKRMYSKNRGIRSKMARTLKRKSLHTPAGLYLGKHFVQTPDFYRWDRVVEKIVRGLYYFEYGSSLLHDTSVETIYISTDERYKSIVDKNINMLNIGKRGWPGVFRYKCNEVVGNARDSMWGLLFYEKFIFWAVTGKHVII